MFYQKFTKSANFAKFVQRMRSRWYEQKTKTKNVEFAAFLNKTMFLKSKTLSKFYIFYQKFTNSAIFTIFAQKLKSRWYEKHMKQAYAPCVALA